MDPLTRFDTPNKRRTPVLSLLDRGMSPTARTER